MVIVDKSEILKKLNKEKEYFEVEFLDKQRLNKIEFKNKIFTDFIEGLRDSTVERYEDSLIFIGNDLIINIDQTSNIKNEPKKPLIFKIEIRFKNTKNEFLLRPFNDSPLPSPNLKGLISNPYKGKDLLDFEIEKEQKNIDFFKRYINEKANWSQYIYALQDNSGQIIECKSINEVIKTIKK